MSDPAAENARSATSAGANRLGESLSSAVAKLPEAERYRLLAELFAGLADRRAASGASAGAAAGELDAVQKKYQRLAEQKALADDALAAAKADLEHQARQADEARARAKELDQRAADQRGRLDAQQKRVSELEDELTSRNARLHEVESELESVKVKLQRAAVAAGDTERIDRLEDGRRELVVQLDEQRAALEQLRKDKDAEIEQLKAERGAAKAASADDGGAAVLAAMWQRLAAARPPLAPGAAKPTPAAAERLVEAFIELIRFVHELDQTLRPFLTSFTRYHQAVARPWDVYNRTQDLQQTVKEIVDVERGKPAAVLRMSLGALKRWMVAAIVAGDASLESIGSELEQQLYGNGKSVDPNRKVRDFLREDGHQLFHQHMRELRSQKLAEAYAKGA